MHEDDDPALAIAFPDQALAAENLQSAEQFQRGRVEPPSMPDIPLEGVDA